MSASLSPPPLLVSYTDLSDVWADIGLASDASSTLNLQQVPFSNSRLLKNVQTRLVRSSAHERLCSEWGWSPASWFRQPVAELVTWQCDDWDGWKKNFKLQLRAMAHSRTPTDPIPIFVFVTKGPLEKSTKVVLDAVQKELAPRAVVHLSQQGKIGMQDLLGAIKSALSQSLEGRIGAYRAEVKKMMGETNKMNTSVDMGALYVAKDSLGALLESAGLYQEACNEYSELEAMIEDYVARQRGLRDINSEEEGSNEAAQRPGEYTSECSVSQGVDECRQLWHSWEGTRRAVAVTARDGAGDAEMKATTSRTYVDFILIPSIVCNMVRLLMKDSKRVEALRVCRTFITNHRALLARYERHKKCPSGMEAAWTFAACISSVIRVCLDVEEQEQLEDIRLLETLKELAKDSSREGSPISKMNAKFHRSIGQMLLEARDVLLSVSGLERDDVEDGVTKESVLQMMNSVDARTFSTKPSSLTPQTSLSTPNATAMASMAFAITQHDVTKSMENIDLDQNGLAPPDDAGGPGRDKICSLDSSHSSHTRSISLHHPMATTMESALSAGGSNMVSNVNEAHASLPLNNKSEVSLLDAEASIDGHAAPLFLILGSGDDETSTSWMPTYGPFRSVRPGGTLSPVDYREFSKIRSIITAAANAFFDRGGYFRNAGILSMQLADDAYKMQDFTTSTNIFMVLADMLEEEKWTGIYQEVLLRLLRSQLQDGDRGIVGTCHRLLLTECNKAHAEMLLRATELAANADGAGTGGGLDDLQVLSLSPCVRVTNGTAAGVSTTAAHPTYFVGDSVRVAVHVINGTGVPLVLDELKALFEIEQEDVSTTANPAGASLTSPHLQHLRVDPQQFQQPHSPFSPHVASQSPTSAFSMALKREGADIPDFRRDRLEGELVSGETTITIPGTKDSHHQVEFYIHPIVPGTYSLTKLSASINTVRVEIAGGGHSCDHHADANRIQFRVEPPETRIRVDPVTRKLVAGEDQWLGVEMDVLRDEFDAPTAMNIEWLPIIRPESPSAPAIINGNRVEPDESLNVPNTSQYTSNAASSTVWWRVSIDKASEWPPEDVRVSPLPCFGPPGYRNGSGPQSQQSHQQAMPLPVPSQLNPGAASNSAPSTIQVHQLPISLLFEDTQRCSRVVSAAATIAVDQPFMVQTEAREVSKGVILVSMKITSSFDRIVAISSVDLRCQQGFSVVCGGIGGASTKAPLTLPPMSSMCASFVLNLDKSLLENRAVAQATVYRTGKLSPSIASIAYSVVTQEEKSMPMQCDLLAPSSNAPAKVYTHDHQIALQLSSIPTDISSTNEFVSLRMLGPFEAIIGCPVTLCWQLERVGGPEKSTVGNRSTVISYEVRADASSWSKGSRAQGAVCLGQRSGSVAMIEMAWTPTTIGSLAMPTLRLHDVYYQQERGKNVIYVTM